MYGLHQKGFAINTKMYDMYGCFAGTEKSVHNNKVIIILLTK